MLNSNCILRPEDGYRCPGRSPENCDGCAYYYKGSFLGTLAGLAIWALMLIGFFASIIITSPLWLIAGLIEKIQRA